MSHIISYDAKTDNDCQILGFLPALKELAKVLAKENRGQLCLQNLLYFSLQCCYPVLKLCVGDSPRIFVYLAGYGQFPNSKAILYSLIVGAIYQQCS